MSAIDTLRREFPGDELWHDFASAVLREVDVPRLEAVFDGIDVETAQVIKALAGDRAPVWYTSRVPALDGATPSQVVAEFADGPLIIRSLLMRFP
jgi:hypothetical protein